MPSKRARASGLGSTPGSSDSFSHTATSSRQFAHSLRWLSTFSAGSRSRLPPRKSGSSSAICSHFIGSPPERNVCGRGTLLEPAKRRAQVLQGAMHARLHRVQLASKQPRNFCVFHFLKTRQDQHF